MVDNVSVDDIIQGNSARGRHQITQAEETFQRIGIVLVDNCGVVREVTVGLVGRVNNLSAGVSSVVISTKEGRGILTFEEVIRF